MAWADMRDRMHERVVAHLNDGTAEYNANDGTPPVRCLPVIVENNLMQNGPEGLMRSDAIGVTWRKQLLETAERGGVFTHCGRRLIVEQVIADDGHMVTAACMEDA